MASTPHVDSDRKNLDARVAAFADADLTEQRAALAELRRDASETDGATYLAAIAILVPILTAISPIKAAVGSLFGVVLVTFVLGVIFALLLWGATHLINRKQRSALSWLGAYEDDLQRRRHAAGYEFEQWRRRH